jgi:hypothetical protein
MTDRLITADASQVSACDFLRAAREASLDAAKGAATPLGWYYFGGGWRRLPPEERQHG